MDKRRYPDRGQVDDAQAVVGADVLAADVESDVQDDAAVFCRALVAGDV
jgi:hypothetical protein